jgi:hypothetical protein
MSTSQSSTTTSIPCHPIQLEFSSISTGIDSQDQKSDTTVTVQADVVIAADGVRSSVTSHWMPELPPPSCTGIQVFVGLAILPIKLVHKYTSLLHERGFYSVGNYHRMFIMPYSAPTLLHPNVSYIYMWQLSAPVVDHGSDNAINKDSSSETLLHHVRLLVGNWHDPIPDLLQYTPTETVWWTILRDRDPVQLQQHLFLHRNKSIAAIDESTQHRIHRVVVIGDACHAMTVFKGQGANQALRDGLTVADWFTRNANRWHGTPIDTVINTNATKKKKKTKVRPLPSSIETTIRGCMREIVQRTAKTVLSSRAAAMHWHSNEVSDYILPMENLLGTIDHKPLTIDFGFTGFSTENVHKLLYELRNHKIGAGLYDQHGVHVNLDTAVHSIIKLSGSIVDRENQLMPDTHLRNRKKKSYTIDEETILAAATAAQTGDTESLRIISFGKPDILRNIVVPLTRPCNMKSHYTTLLHLAAGGRCSHTVYFLWREAGCSPHVRDTLGQLPLDMCPPGSMLHSLLHQAAAAAAVSTDTTTDVRDLIAARIWRTSTADAVT